MGLKMPFCLKCGLEIRRPAYIQSVVRSHWYQITIPKKTMSNKF